MIVVVFCLWTDGLTGGGAPHDSGVGRTRPDGSPAVLSSGNRSSRAMISACSPNEVNVVQLPWGSWRGPFPIQAGHCGGPSGTTQPVVIGQLVRNRSQQSRQHRALRGTGPAGDHLGDPFGELGCPVDDGPP